MAQIVWTEPALNELDEIVEFIALDKIGVAKNLVQSVFSDGYGQGTLSFDGCIALYIVLCILFIPQSLIKRCICSNNESKYRLIR